MADRPAALVHIQCTYTDLPGGTAVTDVLISGASVAGPALAYWLNRRGMRVTIVAKAPAVPPGRPAAGGCAPRGGGGGARGGGPAPGAGRPPPSAPGAGAARREHFALLE